MTKIDTLLEQRQGSRAALYGIGTETERFLHTYGKRLSIVGLLDGFREEGEIYGYPIIPIRSVIAQGATVIIAIARPGSCKAIAKRIGDICREHNIALYDVRGRDLLAPRSVSYTFDGIDGVSRAQLTDRIEAAEIVSFDLFDTLVMRKVLSYTDVFELLEKQLVEQGIHIPDFARLRLSAEKECSVGYAPKLTEIYEEVLRRAGGSFLTAEELAAMEWELDLSLLLPRDAVCEVYREAVREGKKVVITTDCYYREKQIRQLLALFGLDGYEELFISCERGTSKTLRLYEYLREKNGGRTEGILHIGDDETADIECAGKYAIDSCRICSGSDLLDMLGALGMEKEIVSLSDRVKAGLFVSRLLNDPFVFEEGDRGLSVSNAYDVGYLFCAPVITDYLLWLKDRVAQENIPQVLFCARDGFLVGGLYRRIDRESSTWYFLTSRTAAIRAGVEDTADIAYVDSMKFSGQEAEKLRVRFGIEETDSRTPAAAEQAILERAGALRENYKRYINKLGIGTERTAMFDFVAKGTSQMYLQRLFEQHIKGLYFLQLEPEFMADKGLDIEPFYADEEKNTSAVFDQYYILEAILTSPYPSVEEFDEDGNPIYAKETRSEQDIACLKQVQEGIIDYFDDYIRILSEPERIQNKRLDEILLALVGSVRIEDREFLSLTVEDPFFGRMTPIAEVIG